MSAPRSSTKRRAAKAPTTEPRAKKVASRAKPAVKPRAGGKPSANATGSRPKPATAIAAKPKSRRPRAEPSARKMPPAADGLYGIRPGTKLAIIIERLRQKGGTTIEALSDATGWQKHSVHGAISGTLRTKMGIKVETEVRDGVHHYRIVD